MNFEDGPISYAVLKLHELCICHHYCSLHHTVPNYDAIESEISGIDLTAYRRDGIQVVNCTVWD